MPRTRQQVRHFHAARFNNKINSVQGHFLEKTHADGTLVRDYIWADSTPIALMA